MVLTELGGDVYAFTIPVDKAALLLTIDQGRDFDGVPFGDDETRAFLQEKHKAYSGKEYLVWLDASEMLTIEPKGRMRQMRDRLVALLVQSIERGHLKPDRLRRTLDGALDPSATLVDLGELTDWAEIHGIEVSDAMHEYHDDEAKLIEDMRSLAIDWLDRGAMEATRREKQVELEQYPEVAREEIARLITENSRLRTQMATPQDRPISKRAHDSLLKIIAAMAHDCYRDRVTKPYSVAKDVQAAAEQLGLGLSDDTIAAKLKEAIALIPRRPAS